MNRLDKIIGFAAVLFTVVAVCTLKILDKKDENSTVEDVKEEAIYD